MPITSQQNRQGTQTGVWSRLEGWDGEGGAREAQGGGIGIYLWLTDADVWQTSTQYCKAIILQFKINTFKYCFKCGKDNLNNVY